ncbi:helix-turn-helix domain-containing protein [Streptomyces sp. NBC_01808]|uniref:helix-turn-helix domain-containing protein n=1 Tax=Streptomyces sp. NBC_01808 TaxID=2975947 RepID=UPI002DDBB87B|nr:helix-turn-helix transcriptional regulator [Streptomyces sp. NBC_01808]WSA39461.1 helix-turn-helix domain-containing protein [Streptomyces sp. NBC_01808]
MSRERRQQFGAYMARLRHAARLSQRQVAAQLCLAAGVSSVTRNEVSRWERGGRVPDAWLAPLAQTLGVPRGEMERGAAYARGETDTPPPGPAVVLAELLPPDDALTPLVARCGRHLGRADVAGLAGRVHGLRLADDVLAGGDLLAPAFRELRAAVQLYRESTYSEDVRRELLVQIGELAQITGWIASDAGRYDEAARTYALGISAARQAGDGPLLGNLAGSLAYQHANTGREHDGVALAQAALEEAGPGAPAKTRALFYDRIAWAHTRAGEAQPALRALGDAHDALSAAEDDGAPSWAYWVSREELEVMDARVFTELRRPLRAVPLLTDVLTRYHATHTRELALYRSWLAVALVDANEPEQAAVEARQVLALSADIASERAADRSRAVLRRLEGHQDVPEVREVLDDFGYLLST